MKVMASEALQGINRTDADLRAHLFRMIKRILLVLMTVLGLIFIVTERAAVIEWVDHPVKKIALSGEFKYLNEREVEQHLSRYFGTGFLATDLRQLKKDIERLPWVYEATVNRVWPGELQAQIKEQVAVSYWNDNGFLNSEGTLFIPETVDPTWDLPKLVVASDVAIHQRLEIMAFLFLIRQELAAYQLDVAKLEQASRGIWVAHLTNGVRINLGKHDVPLIDTGSLSNKLDRVGKVLSMDSKVDVKTIESIDTRYPNGLAIKWKENTSE